MKIVIISAAYPLRGGIAHFASSLYKELITNHQVKVYTFKRQYPSFLFPGKSQFETGESVEKIPSEVSLDSINPFTWFKVAKQIKNYQPDLVIFKYWLPFFAPCYGIIAQRLKKLKNVKLLAICHNIFPHEKRPGDKLLSMYFLKKINYFVLLSEQVQKELDYFLNKPKSVVLPHPIYSLFGEGVDKQIAKEKLNLPEGRYILFFGFIRAYKGLDILIKSLSLIDKSFNIKLIVAGEFYSDEEKYFDLIKRLGLKDEIILKSNFIPTSDVKYYFSAADAVVLPYRSATQSGIVQIAVNFSKPVIAANVGGISEVIKDEVSGFIVEKENPVLLAKAIERFYSESKETEFTEEMTKLKEKYSWKNFSNGIFEIIKS